MVEATNFPEDLAFRLMAAPAGVHSAKNLRLVERFTRIGPGTVEWTVTIDDPTQWIRPWTYSLPLTEDDSQAIVEYACHEGNYGMANLLSAGRAAEQKAGQSGR